MVIRSNSPAPTATPDEAGWVSLFNGQNLVGWYTWLPSTGRNNDPKGVFKVREGMIHILDIPETGEDQEFGYLGTEVEYQDYILQLEYKWGEKRFPPRANAKRDSGVLYSAVGQDVLWPRSIECQVQEGDTGDLVLLGGVVIDTTVASLNDSPRRFFPGGLPYTSSLSGGEYILKSRTYDTVDDWVKIEIRISGGSVYHSINGSVNMQAYGARQIGPGGPGELIPLKKGRILLQAEGAEIYYRNIRIKPLS